ncbi:hypothetical protein Bca52824_005316 [Brassica carinata]|uniref:Glycosyl hydrolase family 38 C-terminal domain-containing protein n=1 Tax=Brassica carinata TaxID=52824 RepID=A0A8X7WQM7_BRACI|nr:hypothetical protein Bca52824_005316 [Brassica carinata]
MRELASVNAKAAIMWITVSISIQRDKYSSWHVFSVSVPPLGFTTYTISTAKRSGGYSSKSHVSRYQKGEQSIVDVGQGNLKLSFSTDQGKTINYFNSRTSMTEPLKQTFSYYSSYNGTNDKEPQPNPPFIVTEERFGPGPPYREGLYLYLNTPRFADTHNWTPVDEPRRRNCRSMKLGEFIGCTLAELVAEDGGGGFFWRRTHHHQHDADVALVHYLREIPFAAAEDEDEEDDEEEDEAEAEAEAESESESEEEAAAEDEGGESTDDDLVNDPTYLPGLGLREIQGSTLVSRVDTLMDKMLEKNGTPEALDLRGKAAVSQAALAHQLYQKKFSGPRWEALVKKGAKKLRFLWASTSVNNPAYSDTLYVAPLIGPDTVPLTVIRGPLVDEVHQQLNPWISQVTIVYKGKEHVEVEFIVGNIPIKDGVGKEVVTQISSSLKSDKTFYTDSSGRDYIKRIRDYRSDWKLEVNQPVAGNYYPINHGIYLQDSQKEFSVMVDRAIGGSSIVDGQVELMLHRIDSSYSLPPDHVALLTLQELYDGNVLLRLAHLYEVGENKDLSGVSTVELKKLFCHILIHLFDSFV